MTPEQMKARMAELAGGLEYVAATPQDQWTDEVQRSWDEANAEFDQLEKALERRDQAETKARAAAERGRTIEPGNPGFNVNPGLNREDPFDLSTLRFDASGADLRERALTAVEKLDDLTDAQRSAATRMIERADTPSGALARHVLATGSEAYRTGFQKLVGGHPHLISEAERTAIEAARALSLTDANGGYAVPTTLDPTIISTSDGSANPFRQISSIKTTVTDNWNGITSGGMSVSWDGEAAEVSDDSPTLGAAGITPKKAQGFAVGSIEISQDWKGIEEDLRSMIQDGKDDAEAVVFATGSGANQPTGIVTALVAGAGTVPLVTPTTAETFAVADLYKLEETLPPKYRQAARAKWLANKAIYNDVRAFGTSDGHALWERVGAGQPAELLGYQVHEASAMDSGFDATATANNYLLILGDFRFYVIVDRVGLSVEFVPHVFGANGRPTGQRGWYCYWRVGADSVNDNAFRMLNIATTA
jgi:HK97 family phage major capsid protein